jgi:hypothetical protein
MDDADLEEALRVFLAPDPTGGVMPIGAMDRLRARYGLSADRVYRQVMDFLTPLTEIPEAWARESYQTIGSLVERRARELRPELADVLCKAIGNLVSYEVWHG